MSIGVTCAELLESKIKMEQIWRDAQANADYIAEVEALKVIKANQRGAEFPDLTDPNKDRTVKIVWLTDCNPNSVVDCPDECTIAGNEIADNCKDYELTVCKSIEFSIPEKRFRTSMWSKEEVMAKSMMTNMRILDEYIVQAMIAKMDTFTGTNAFLGSFSTSGSDTVIPAVNWTPNLYGYFVESMIMNRMRDAYMLSGHNMFQQDWNIMKEAGNAQGGAANVAKANTFQKYFDLFNMDSTLGAKKTFLVRPSSMAFVSKNYYGPAPEEIKGKAAIIRYSVQSFNLPFITYDVLHDTECVQGLNNGDIKYKWRLSFKGDLFQNPTNCDGTKTGLLSFLCQ